MPEKKYIVFVTDHAHYMEEDGEYTRGEFDTFELAAQKCKKIMDGSLQELFTKGMKSEDLLKQFLLFGEEASTENFNSREYVEKQCLSLCS